MNRLILLLTTALIAICCSTKRTDKEKSNQSFDELQNRLSLLNEIESPANFKRDTTGFANLPAFEYFCDNENINKTDYYSVADLNFDGQNDLIYSGPCRPYDQTAIFIRERNKLLVVYDYPGKVLSIDFHEFKTTIHSLFLPTGCGSEAGNELIEITTKLPSP